MTEGRSGEPTEDAGDAEVGSSDLIIDLVAQCLERVDVDGDAAIEAVCHEHPEHAQAILDRISVLRRLGLAQPALAEERPFGRYALLRELGRGGMGIVYLARDPVMGREVALKALGQRLVVSDRARSRFEREIRAIAQLQHPRIVPVFDVGEVDGVPYFTMEYVAGRTLGDVLQTLRRRAVPTTELSTTHLSLATFSDEGDAATPPLEEPASGDGPAVDAPPPVPALPSSWGKSYVETVCRLTVDIADALQHAHDNGVVHRDVKPSNVLIRRDGRACLFDFGLARLESDESLTLTGDFAGTPFYVSPEQARGKGIDNRSDVYSLGATLYEVLTLQRPFAGESAQAVFRQILTRDPAPPRQVNRMVPRDLETICLTALDKDPAKRYQSAGELAADLRRFLEFQPIRARSTGPVGRAWRIVRRNPLPAALLSVVFLSLFAGVVGLAWANRAVAAEAARAEAALKEARNISNFLTVTLTSVEPSAMGYDVTVRNVLDSMAERMGRGFVGQPAVEAYLRETIGDTYYEIGRAADGVPHLRRGMELYEQEYGRSDPRLAACLQSLGRALHGDSQFDEAETHLRRSLAIWNELGEEGSPDDGIEKAYTLASLGATISDGRDANEESRLLFEEALAIRTRVYGPESEPVASTLEALARLQLEVRQDQSALELMIRALEMRAAVLGDDRHPSMATGINNLAAVYHHLGQTDRAEELYQDALEIRIESQGRAHPEVAQGYANLGNVRWRQGDHEGAAKLLAEAAEIAQEVFPGESLLLAKVLVNQGRLAQNRQSPHDALALFERAHSIELRILGEGHSESASTALYVARALRDLGRLDEAAAIFEQALDLSGHPSRSDGTRADSALYDLGIIELRRGNLDRSEELLREAIESGSQYLNSHKAELFLARDALVDVLSQKEQYDAAADLAAELLDSRCGLHFGESVSAISRTQLAGLRYAEGREEESETLFRDALFEFRNQSTSASLERVDALSGLADLLIQTDRAAQAEPLLFEARTIIRDHGAFDSLAAVHTEYLYAVCLMRLGRGAEAEPLLLDAWARLLDMEGEDSPRSRVALAQLAELYRDRGDFARAAEMEDLYALMYGAD